MILLADSTVVDPILIEVSPAQLSRLVPYYPPFRVWVEMDEFGGNTIRIRQIPTILENSDWDQLIQDLVDDVMDGGFVPYSRTLNWHWQLGLGLWIYSCRKDFIDY